MRQPIYFDRKEIDPNKALPECPDCLFWVRESEEDDDVMVG